MKKNIFSLTQKKSATHTKIDVNYCVTSTKRHLCEGNVINYWHIRPATALSCIKTVQTQLIEDKLQ